MDFGFSEDQEMLRASVREYLRAEAPASYARAMMPDPVGSTEKVWKEIAELGWLGLTVPEAHGGSGLGLLDLAIVMEEAGAVVFPADVFRALRCTSLTSMRVLILGQDPYHGPGQADGLAFSVAAGHRHPPSLRNIFKELHRDLGIAVPLSGSLLPSTLRRTFSTPAMPASPSRFCVGSRGSLKSSAAY